ncbi:hypothetical protein [Enterococcus sp. N249-2]
MNEKEMNITDAYIDAQSLVGSLRGLEIFADYELSSLSDISLNSISMLKGMIAAIATLAEKHDIDMQRLESNNFGVKNSGI